MNILYLIRGVPGAGKSTFAKKLFYAGLIDWNFEADMYFSQGEEYKFNPAELKKAHEWCQIETRKALAAGYNVAVSNTSCTEWEVGTYEIMALECGAEFVSIIVENRHGNSSIHSVPNETVEKMKAKFSVKL